MITAHPKFIESICCVDGMFYNLERHQLRVNRTFDRFFPGFPALDLAMILPDLKIAGKVKVRVVYDLSSYTVTHQQYVPKSIDTLGIVDCESFDYSYKYENRNKLNELLELSKSDDVIICTDGCVRDSSYSNLAFWDGNTWWTPKEPLLNGVRRAQLLSAQRIKEREIKKEDLNDFSKVSLINAMLDLEELVVSM